MGQTQRGYDFPRSRGKLVSRMERLGARSKTAYRESGTNRFKPSPTTPGSSRNRPYDRPAFATDFTCPRSAFTRTYAATLRNFALKYCLNSCKCARYLRDLNELA